MYTFKQTHFHKQKNFPIGKSRKVIVADIKFVNQYVIIKYVST